ncbi:GNAT family N-acetyltransferase [bacterium]|nr:MAG: GNAT family N-acetyltransferase [bacterium]MBV6516030.1 Mycothiol acetyltransferase [Planctomycetota bacterium]HRJ77507.1 GNAT family N-acetyltransferase [Planctomycetota bacterium]
MEYRKLSTADAHAYNELRCEMLRAHPDAFGDSLEEHLARGFAEVQRRLEGKEDSQVFGAFLDGHLVGAAGFFRESHNKARHVATIWGVYTRPQVRGQGVSAALIKLALEALRGLGVDLVQLDVGSHNVPARRVYEQLGFVKTGLWPRALRVNGVDYDEDHMVLDLRRR